MVRRNKAGAKGKNARVRYNEGWYPPVREYAPLPTPGSPLADKVTAIEIYSGPYLVAGHAAHAATAYYGVSYIRFAQAIAALAHDPAVIAAKPRETRLMREQMRTRAATRARARVNGAPDPLRHARKPPSPGVCS